MGRPSSNHKDRLADDQQAQGRVSMTAHAKSFAKRPSRRSILQGLGAAAIGISLSGKKYSAAWAAEEPKLNFYNWDTYIGDTTLEDFKNASGIDVNMSLFAPTHELMLPSLKTVARDFTNDAPYDRGRKYSMPYTWLVIGIGYRKSKVKDV